MVEHNNYLKTKVIEISQLQTGIVLVGKITFQDLSTIHRLTERKESLFDPFGEKKQKPVKDEDTEFQRQLRPAKLKEISEYLEENFSALKEGKSLGLFPTSLIVSLKHEIDYDSTKVDEKFLETQFSAKLDSCFFDANSSELHIPKNKRIALIVDGQHRFYGTKMFIDSLSAADKKEALKFEFPVTFLVGFDIYEVGKLFATVNFKQKPVNRSLYYDIFGSVGDTERNDIKLAHDLALHLNNNGNSPLKDMIRMLGKGFGLFSQSFFVEKMLIHFKEKGVWEKIFADYLKGGKSHLKLPTFMIIYFECVEELYNSAWPTRINRDGKLVYSPYKYDYILCKTTGLGAMFRLIRDIYPLVENESEGVMRSTIKEILSRLSAKDAKRIFSKNSDYGSTGGEGIQVKLYRYLKSKLNLK